MRSVAGVTLVGALILLAGCEENPLRSRTPSEPLPPAQGAQAFIQVDNENARPGDEVAVYVRVQLGENNQSKVGSYTGKLRYNPESLEWVSDQSIDDGLRVTNPGAADGEVRFAGASATGFTELMLYAGRFRVKEAGYANGVSLEMQELSAAATLSDLKPQLRIAPQVFLRSAGN